MKKVLLFFFIVFLSCKEEAHLNKKTEVDFNDYLLKEITKRKKQHKNISVYLDSLEKLPQLKKQHKAKVLLWKSMVLLHANQFEKAIENHQKIYELIDGEENTMLVNYYYSLGIIDEKQDNFYKALYNYNQAGEILGRTQIYHTSPSKADVLLMAIAFKNKEMKLPNSTIKYLEMALKKHTGFNDVSSEFVYDYNIMKANVFSSKEMFNKDSANFYFSMASELNFQPKPYQIHNRNYAKAEYYFNASRLDSAKIYINKLPQNLLDQSAVDELNLLSIYSNLKAVGYADKILRKINWLASEGKLTSNDSLLYYENVVDYYLAKNDIENVKKSIADFNNFRIHFDKKEIQKNINELATVLDLQQKDKQISLTQKKYLDSVRLRNIFVFSGIILLLLGIIAMLYFRAKTTKKRLILEKNAVDLKMKLLQSQINPHFIFNTLAAIQSHIRQQKNKEAIIYLNKFSTLMRQILNLSRDESTKLNKELEVLKTYVEVQQLRNNNFDLQIELDEEVEDLQNEIVIPALSLQPFVENSILHGFKNIEYRGLIVIKIYADEKSLFLTVTDNGKGMVVQSKPKEKKSHGIAIIKEQFEVLGNIHQQEIEFSVKNRKDTKGVEVRLKIPIILS